MVVSIVVIVTLKVLEDERMSEIDAVAAHRRKRTSPPSPAHGTIFSDKFKERIKFL